jgi:hypothetical protein
LVEQGLSIRIIERGHPFDDPGGGKGEFQRARVIWLGFSPGVEWLHEEANRRLASKVDGWYYVESELRSTHVGAAGEVARLIVEFLGAGVSAKVVSDLIDFAKQRVRKYHDSLGVTDFPPDFSRFEIDDLVGRLRDELAEILELPAERLELTGDRLTTKAIVATTFRDAETGIRYRVDVDTTEVMFTREHEKA